MIKNTTPFAVILFFFLTLFLYTKLAGPIPFTVNSTTTTKSDLFTVAGEGVVNIQPDIASVNVGVQANGSTVKQAQERINQAINSVSEAIKKLGIESKDIQTTNYNINPIYDYNSGSQRITGYQASTNLLVKVKDIDKVNQVIDTATTNGANQLFGVNFDVEDRTKAENEAREKAVADAKQKAENAAKIAGFNLGKIINYNESFGDSPRPVMMPFAAGGAEKEDRVTSIEPGSSEIKVTVILSYEIR